MLESLPAVAAEQPVEPAALFVLLLFPFRLPVAPDVAVAFDVAFDADRSLCVFSLDAFFEDVTPFACCLLYALACSSFL